MCISYSLYLFKYQKFKFNIYIIIFITATFLAFMSPYLLLIPANLIMAYLLETGDYISSNISGLHNLSSGASFGKAGWSAQVGSSTQAGLDNQGRSQGIGGLSESIADIYEIATRGQAAVRNGVIANGYNPYKSNLPYAAKLADKLVSLRATNNHLQTPTK